MRYAAMLACVLVVAGCTTCGGMGARGANSDIVLEVLGKGLARADMDVIHEYVAEDYRQHNPYAADGRAGLIEFIHSRSPAEKQELSVVRIFEDGEFVFAHSELIVQMKGEDKVIKYALMDLWRVKDGMLVEHWDAMQEHPLKTASGRTMLGGPTEVTDRDKTEANRKLVRNYVTTVLVNGEIDRIREFTNDTYAQHNPGAKDGPQALYDFLKAGRDAGISFKYEIKRVFAEGNFVLVQARGEINGSALAIYDLFRCEDGKVAEHWDVIQPIPETSRNSNGMLD